MTWARVAIENEKSKNETENHENEEGVIADAPNWRQQMQNSSEFKGFLTSHGLTSVNQVTVDHLRSTFNALWKINKLEAIFFSHVLQLNPPFLSVDSEPVVNHMKYLQGKRLSYFKVYPWLYMVEKACLNDRLAIDIILSHTADKYSFEGKMRSFIAEPEKTAEKALEFLRTPAISNDASISKSPAVAIISSLILDCRENKKNNSPSSAEIPTSNVEKSNVEQQAHLNLPSQQQQQNQDQAEIAAQLNTLIEFVIGAELNKNVISLYNISMAGYRYKSRRAAQILALQYAKTLRDPSEKKTVIEAVLVSLSKEDGSEIRRFFSRGRSRLEDMINANITNKDVYTNTAGLNGDQISKLKQKMMTNTSEVSWDYLIVIKGLGEKLPEPKQPTKTNLWSIFSKK